MKNRLICTISAIIFFFSCTFLAACSAPAPQSAPSVTTEITENQAVVYDIFIGLTDADMKQQNISIDDAASRIDKLFEERGLGYTRYMTDGAFTREDGSFQANQTIVYGGLHAEPDLVLSLIDSIKKELNLEVVYCESRLVGYQIFGGVVEQVGA